MTQGQRYNANKKAKICVICGSEPAASGKLRCNLCNDYARLASQRVREKRWLEGRCCSCGRMRDEIEYKVCSACRARARNRARAKAQAIRDERPKRTVFDAQSLVDTLGTIYREMIVNGNTERSDGFHDAIKAISEIQTEMIEVKA